MTRHSIRLKVVRIGSNMVELDHSNDLTKPFSTTLATHISPPARFFFPFSRRSLYCGEKLGECAFFYYVINTDCIDWVCCFYDLYLH